MIELYKKNHLAKEYTSLGLFRAVNKCFKIERVLYPGSYVHITPSLVFSQVVYVDSFRNTYKFYESQDVRTFINKNKEYSEKAFFRFHQQDYTKSFQESYEAFYLVIRNVQDL